MSHVSHSKLMKQERSCVFYCPVPDSITKQQQDQKQVGVFKRLLQLLLQYFEMKEIKELILSVRSKPGILKEPYRTWVSGASGRLQLLENQWQFITQSKGRGLVQSIFCVPNYRAKQFIQVRDSNTMMLLQ